MTKEYKYNTYKEALDAVKGDGGKLRFVRPDLITYEMALEAVKECGLALEHVREDLITYEMALEAVKECGLALEHVPTQLPKPERKTLTSIGGGRVSIEDGWVLRPGHEETSVVAHRSYLSEEYGIDFGL